MVRIIAVVLIFLPGIICALGIKVMRDAFFAEVYPFLVNEVIQFIVGLLMFVGGLTFIGGFIYHRDKKRNLLKEQQTKNV